MVNDNDLSQQDVNSEQMKALKNRIYGHEGRSSYLASVKVMPMHVLVDYSMPLEEAANNAITPSLVLNGAIMVAAREKNIGESHLMGRSNQGSTNNLCPIQYKRRAIVASGQPY